jgi:hypothetical protein
MTTTSHLSGLEKAYWNLKQKLNSPFMYVGSMLYPFMRKGIQTKLKKRNVKTTTSNTLRRYLLVIGGKRNFLRFDFNDM